MFVDFDSQKDVSIPKTERLEMAPKRRNPGQIFLRVMAEKWCERPNSRHRLGAVKRPLWRKADNHPDQITGYNSCDDCPAAPPLSTASDTYGWLCEEFALARAKPSSIPVPSQPSSEEARSSVSKNPSTCSTYCQPVRYYPSSVSA
jgi:hypothetical protein